MWRTVTLTLVYLAMVAHVVHWKIAGRTLAPLELNEVMYTLELGIVTAGFLFMAFLVLATMVFGRFFCSWGCHILALEDGASWLLEKVGIRPKQVRSRALMFVPMGALLYMFVWPQVERLWQGGALPRLHIEGEGSAWASFMTSDYSRNLPGPWVAALTFFICGGVIVYLLGSRTFCRYACPYGALFAVADRVAPGRIMKSGNCDACGLCTASCQSDINVHKELEHYGTVVDSACMKDLDCISACPDGAIKFGFTKPSLFRKRSKDPTLRKNYDYSASEELSIAALFLSSLVVLRGLYGVIPFLLALALAAIVAFLSVHAYRLLKRPAGRFGQVQLKLAGSMSRAGWIFLGSTLLFVTFVGHSALVRYHHFAGQRAYESLVASSVPFDEDIYAAIEHLESTRSRALMPIPGIDRMLAGIHAMSSRPTGAVTPLRRMIEENPRDVYARSQLVRVLHGTGQFAFADREIDSWIEVAKASEDTAHSVANAYELRGALMIERGQFDAALVAFEMSLEVHPESSGALRSMGEALANMGRFDEAKTRLESALDLKEDSALTHYNLAVVCSMLEDTSSATQHYVRAVELDPSDPEIRNNLGYLYMETGSQLLAEAQFKEAIALNPRFAPAYFNLGRLRLAQGQRDQARELLMQAASLDSRFAPALQELGFGTPAR